MVYNPDTRRWEGNEGDLKVFESPNLISCTTLQAPLSLSLPQQQSLRSSSSSSNISTSSESGGGMVFDAVLMRWVGNEDEFKDVF